MPKGFVYILECSDGSFYTGRTVDLDKRLRAHQSGRGANHTKKSLPLRLVYVEAFQTIDDAIYRKKQIQGWNRAEKMTLIKGKRNALPKWSMTYGDKAVPKTMAASKASIPNTVSSNLASQTLEETKTYYSNGKLLFTGEYVVLDGARALALPTTLGQSLTIAPLDGSRLVWTSLDDQGKVWYEEGFDIEKQGWSSSRSAGRDTHGIGLRLREILEAARSLNPHFLNGSQGYRVTTQLAFPKDWGLGTSSTLINNIAQWAHVDPYRLLALTFGGSGYDIACAQHNYALTYQLKNKAPIVTAVDFNPSFKDRLYFVYLNKKQNSREGIAHYKKAKTTSRDLIKTISNITEAMVCCASFSTFQDLMRQHEAMISKAIQQVPVKVRLFPDFKGAVKSLGAWGGDFILVASKEDPGPYFKGKGYPTVLRYSDLISV
ncbi:GYDIA family GHMP kinase [Aestuariivivens sediminis]|uniref:GYDIA family GHMP kinase n=1 Tax=Aestuariivivens sediminis TaxID=2913557 RepID=UPI0030B81F46